MSTDLAARYGLAEKLLAANQKALIHKPMVAPAWIRDTETFWYRNRTAAGSDYVFVDASAGTKRPAFDHERLAKSLSALLGTDVDPNALPFFVIDLRADNTVRFTVGSQRIAVSLETYDANVVGVAHPDEAMSPDGQWSVGRRDHNLYLRNVATDEIRTLTTDGAEDLAYAIAPGGSRNQTMQENLGFTMPPFVLWSPDSTKFVTYRLDERLCSHMHLIRSAPLDGGRPAGYTYRYSVVGDEHVAQAEYVVFDAATGAETKATCGPVDMAYVSSVALGFVWWEAGRLFFIVGDRGDKNVWIKELDPVTGDVTEVLHTSNADQVLLGPQFTDRFVRLLASGETVIWSERSGWGHLYLVGTDGEWKALTTGDWLVRKLVNVDETERRAVFTAGGFDPDGDPYIQQLCAVSLDTGEITALTSDGLDHECLPSKSGTFFVDNTSRVDVPNVAVLRNGAGDVVLELEQADASGLFDLGFIPCERVKVKAADGVTDIWAGIYKPIGFDESESYPVLEEIYPGPQINTVPMRFPHSGGVMTGAPRAFEMLGLGFVVVTVDGAGSALRSHAFSNDARYNGRGNLIPDHVAAIKQLAATRPWMDIERMGIYGHSGGGYASVRAILQAPDFYKVCVSSAGDHDDHTYHAWWGEKYFGLEDEHDYADASNSSLAENLRGKLLLGHGEMDDNVTPHLTMRLVDALIKANKNFDLKIVPNADHSMFHNLAWWSRQRWDYFVTHLMGEEPPAYRVADVQYDAELLAALMA